MRDFGITPKIDQVISSIPWKRERGAGFERLSLASLRERQLAHQLSELQRLKFHLLIFFHQGDGKHMVDFTEYECPPNSVIHVSPNQLHSFRSAHDSEAELLVFQEEVLASLLGEGDESLYASQYAWPPFVQLTTEEAAFVTELFHLLTTRQTESGEWKDAQSARFLALAIAASCRQAAIHRAKAPISSETDSRYAKFVDLMERNFRAYRSAMWYAREVGCSYRTLCRVCEVAVGVTPKTLLDERVFMEARRLLGYSRDPIYEIAYELGFSESTNFVKFFQRLAGETPEAFRKRWQS